MFWLLESSNVLLVLHSRDALVFLHGRLPKELPPQGLTPALIKECIVFFDGLSARCEQLADDMHQSETLLILGTSLKVRSASDLVADFAGSRFVHMVVGLLAVLTRVFNCALLIIGSFCISESLSRQIRHRLLCHAGPSHCQRYGSFVGWSLHCHLVESTTKHIFVSIMIGRRYCLGLRCARAQPATH